MRSMRLGVRVTAALLAAGALVASGLAWASVRQFTSSIQTGAALPSAEAGAPGQPKRDIDGKDENILLLGNDSIQGATPAELAALGTTADRSSEATDTMMIMHIPANGAKATVISFPRDSWVDIPGHGPAKLNSAYSDAFVDAQSRGSTAATSAGIALAAATLTQLTGLHIDHYVQINLLGFYEISEAIGGVDLCLNAAQNASTEGDDSHPNGYSGINLAAGWNRNVKGLQAEAFVRQRHGLPRGDIDRIVRQQYFLSAVFKKATSAGMLLNPLKLQSVFHAVSRSLFTDPSLDVLSLVQQFQKIAAGNITFGTPPIADINGHVGDQSVVLIDPDAVKQYVNRLIGVPTDPRLARAAPVAPSTVQVRVLNASGQSNSAARIATALTQAGFVASAGDADGARAATTIEYSDGFQGQAKTVARWFPKAQLALSPSAHGVVIVLGQDGQQPAQPRTAASQPAPGAASSSAQPVPAAAPGAVARTTPPAGTSNAAQNAAGCIN